ncbi:MAG TPA: 5-formyltetrahydrofolate cyclo-ligase [Chitinophagaceae bacterium]|nr:5-formyltetrahydrofolate cyclo-ligase [Chitinophagaceae bacterium]
MIKQELRKLYKQKRSQLSGKERLKLDDLLLIQFQQLSFNHVVNVLSYWPLQEQQEINTFLFTDYLQFRMPGMQLCFPVIDPATRSFKAFAVNEDTRFALNAYKIGEPVDGQEIPAGELDLVIAPLLCFDKKGYRVGYGKGFYDRFLQQCRADVIKAGLSYFEPEERIEDIDEFDVPLSVCITPHNIYEF